MMPAEPARDLLLVQRELSSLRLELGQPEEALAHAEAAAIPGIVETVPTYRSLLVHYDPLRTRQADLIGALEPLVENQSLDPVRVQIMLDGLRSEDLDEDLLELGLADLVAAQQHQSLWLHRRCADVPQPGRQHRSWYRLDCQRLDEPAARAGLRRPAQ